MTALELAGRTRTVVRGSALVTAVGHVARGLFARSADLCGEFAGNPAADADHAQIDSRAEMDAVLRLVRTSRLVAVLWWPVRRVVSAWRVAGVPAFVVGLRRTVGALEDAQACRLAGVVLGVAVITDGLLRQFDPRPASLLRTWLWGASLAVAVLMISGARQVVDAWRARGPKTR